MEKLQIKRLYQQHKIDQPLKILQKKRSNYLRETTWWTCKIINHWTGWNIENISEYSMEKKVLVGSYTPFIIKTIRQVISDYVEVDLWDCNEINDDESVEWIIWFFFIQTRL